MTNKTASVLLFVFLFICVMGCNQTQEHYIKTHECHYLYTIPGETRYSEAQGKVVRDDNLEVYGCSGIDQHLYIARK